MRVITRELGRGFTFSTSIHMAEENGETFVVIEQQLLENGEYQLGSRRTLYLSNDEWNAAKAEVDIYASVKSMGDLPFDEL